MSKETAENPKIEVELVPIATIAVEIGETVDSVLTRFAGHVELNHYGMRCVPSVVAMEFFARQYEWRVRHEEDRQRRVAEIEANQTVLVGVPAVEGSSPHESMAAAAGGLVSPHEEFGGFDKPSFLQDQLAAGARALAEKREQNQAREKDRAAAALKDQLR